MESERVVFTVYIDDSGTAPDQPVAIAAALIVPASRIEDLDSRWDRLKRDHLIPEFHSSECAAGAKRTSFAGWGGQRKKMLFHDVRKISKEFSVKAISFAVHKSDYDEVIPENDQLRTIGGTRFHYTWAIGHVIALLDMWSLTVTKTPFEYVFDCMGTNTKRNAAKKEIETVMAQADSLTPGRYEGHYSFRNRQDHPGLQCSDLLAWSSYQWSCSRFKGRPLHPLAEETFSEYDAYRDNTWMFAITLTKDQLEEWAEKERADPRSIAQRQKWMQEHGQ
jgi:hypothetical protein